MIQTESERAAALVTILPLLLPRRLPGSPLGRLVESLPDPGDKAPPPAPFPCHWMCWRCSRAPRCTIEEPWMKEYLHNCRAYRVNELSAAMEVLRDLNPYWYFAVWYTHVNPWSEWQCDRREEWCREGLQFLSDSLQPGHLYPMRGPYREPTTAKSLTSEIRRLRFEEKLSFRVIAKELRISKSAVHYVVNGRSKKKSIDKVSTNVVSNV